MRPLRKESSAVRTPKRTSTPSQRPTGPAGSGGHPVAARLLDLQATAGNASVAQLVSARRPSVQRDAEGSTATTPEADKRIAPDQLQKTLVDERNKALAGYREAGKGLDVLEKAEKAGTLSPEDTEKKAQLQKTQDEHHAFLTQAEKDLLLINEPGATNQAVNEMKARRAVNATAAETTESSRTGVRLDASGITSSKKDVTSELKDGKATTTTSGTTNTLDSTGLSHAKSSSTSVVEGATTTTRQEGKDNTTSKLDWSGGDLAVSSTSTDKATKTTTGGLSTSEATVESRKLGLSGYTTSTENTETVDDAVASSKKSTSVTRGDGKIGKTTTTSSKFGTQDAQGALTKGNEQSTTTSKGVIAGPEGVGGFGSATKDLSQTHAKGVKTGQSAGMDGKFVVNVTQVPGKDPPQYRISLTINLGAKVGASGSVDKDTSEGGTGKATGSVSGSVSGSVTGTFVHVFDADKTNAYLGTLAASGSGGAEKEMGVLALAAKGSIADAQAMLRGLKKDSTSATALAGMSDGDSVEIALDGKVEGGVSGGHSTTGGFGLKGSYTRSHGETLKASAAKNGDKIVLTITALKTDTAGGGGAVSFNAASGGHTATSTTGSGESISFTLSEKDPAYKQHLATITGANSMDDLRQLAAKHPELVGSRTTSMEEASTGTTSAGVGPASLELTETHAYSESTTTDEKGTTRNFSGSTGGGAAISGPGGLKASYSEKDTVATKVGPDKKASGDSSTTKAETDYSGSAKALGKKLSDAPVAAVTGLVTGSTKYVQETTEVAGMKLSDADYETIAGAAQSPKHWDNAGIGTLHTSDLIPWRRLAKAIARANGDRTEIGRLMAVFASEHGDAAKAFNRVVRPAGSETGGAKYEWPGELANEKAAYETLITGSPTAPAKELEAAGKHKEALDLVNGTLPKIDALVSAMQGKRDKFTDGAAYAEMLGAVATRRGEIAKQATTLRHQLASADGKSALPPPDVTTVPTPEQQKAQEDIEKSAAKAELDGLQPSLNAFLDKQTKAFGIVQAEQEKDKKKWSFSKADVILISKTLTELKNDVFPQWDATLKTAREAAKKAGLDPGAVGPVPARGFYDKLHHDSFAGW